MKGLVAALAVVVAAPAAWAQAPVLTVYTYSSFTAEWGPGPQIEKAFEAECACDLQFVSVEDGVALLSRLRLEGAGTSADVVLGLDTNLTAEAAATGLFAPHAAVTAELDLPFAWDDPLFVPYDWSYFAFVYDTTAVPEPPKSLHDLVYASDVEIAIQDPRTSTPGLGLLLWMKSVFEDEAAAAWAALRPRIVTVTPGWSESYGLFTAGEVPMVLSYITSPPYHRVSESDDTKAAAVFEEGHYMQIEVAGRLAGTDQPELADRFLAFLLSPTVQEMIPTTQWMYPVVLPEGGLPPAFSEVVGPDEAILMTPEEVAANRQAWVDEWLAAMSE